MDTQDKSSIIVEKYILSIESESRVTYIYPKILSVDQACVVSDISDFIKDCDLNLEIFLTAVEGGLSREELRPINCEDRK